jgi:hypothetical protein
VATPGPILFRSDGGRGKAARVACHDSNTTDQDAEERVRGSYRVCSHKVTKFNFFDTCISMVHRKARLTLVVEAPSKWSKSYHPTNLFKIHETFTRVTPLC